ILRFFRILLDLCLRVWLLAVDGDAHECLIVAHDNVIHYVIPVPKGMLHPRRERQRPRCHAHCGLGELSRIWLARDDQRVGRGPRV
ncbi:hypothetical protein FB45DRAFT_1112105, partial [Roridomyces roridus]